MALQKAEIGKERFVLLRTSFFIGSSLDKVQFRLLLDASYGTRFHNFVDELVRIEVEYTYKYMDAVGCPMYAEGVMTKKLLHIVTTSRFESIFEVIRHGMSREEAVEYINLLSRYHRAGFFAIFGAVQAT